MEQLYPLLFQVPSMPKDGYVCESFTRAIVSKVLMFTSMNWVLLAEEKWQGKSGKGEVVCYQVLEEEQIYKTAFLDKMTIELSAIESELNKLEQERKLASDIVEDIQNSLEAIAFA